MKIDLATGFKNLLATLTTSMPWITVFSATLAGAIAVYVVVYFLVLKARGKPADKKKVIWPLVAAVFLLVPGPFGGLVLSFIDLLANAILTTGQTILDTMKR